MSETTSSAKKQAATTSTMRSVRSSNVAYAFQTNSLSMEHHCVLCSNDKHPLYTCPRFKSRSQEERR